jgi:ankyrin repeat protein
MDLERTLALLLLHSGRKRFALFFGVVLLQIDLQGRTQYSFGGFENVDRAMNTIQRTLYGSVGNTAIHQAVEHKDYDKVKALLEYDPTKLNQFNKAEQLPLHLAFTKNDAEMARLLLDYYGFVLTFPFQCLNC